MDIHSKLYLQKSTFHQLDNKNLKNPNCCWERADRTYVLTVSNWSLLLSPVCFNAI